MVKCFSKYITFFNQKFHNIATYKVWHRKKVQVVHFLTSTMECSIFLKFQTPLSNDDQSNESEKYAKNIICTP